MPFHAPIDPSANHALATRAAVAAPSRSRERSAANASIAARERRLDDTLDASFPASDPPPWTLGRRTRSPRKP